MIINNLLDKYKNIYLPICKWRGEVSVYDDNGLCFSLISEIDISVLSKILKIDSLPFFIEYIIIDEEFPEICITYCSDNKDRVYLNILGYGNYVQYLFKHPHSFIKYIIFDYSKLEKEIQKRQSLIDELNIISDLRKINYMTENNLR